jgi:hypothetical protein
MQLSKVPMRTAQLYSIYCARHHTAVSSIKIPLRKSEELLTQLSKVNAALTSNNQVIAEQSHQLEKLNATKDKF